MIKAWVIYLFLLSSMGLCQQQLSFGVKSTVQSQLDNVLTALVNELRLYNTSFQDNTRLSRQIDFTWDTLQIILRELAPYTSVTMGANNSVSGSKDIVLGSFNNITGGGGNNYIFTNYYTGKISGDLVIDRYRIQMDKKSLTATKPEQVVFFLTPAETSQYSKYFSTRPVDQNLSAGTVTLFKLANIGQLYQSSYSVPYQSPPVKQPVQTQQQTQQTTQQIQNKPPAFQPVQSQNQNQQSFQQTQQQQQFQFQPSQSQQGFQQTQQQQNYQGFQTQPQQGFQQQPQQNFQSSQSQFQPSSSTSYGNFQLVGNQQQSSGNLRGDSDFGFSGGFSESASGNNFSGFTSTFSSSSSSNPGGFVRV